MTIETQGFSKLRAIFFPIYGHELKKFLPMGMMMFFILFNYNIVRDTKDTLVVNSAGAEALSLIKLIGTVPGAILIMLFYSKLSTLLSKEGLFYTMLIPFIIFFGMFAFAIYPNRELLHPSLQSVQELSLAYPRFKTLFAVWGSWSYALFYILSELWGSVVLGLLFWRFANDIVDMKQAKRFYSLFGFMANFGLIAAGTITTYLSQIRENLSPNIDPWGMSLNYLMTAVVVAGLSIISIYAWMNRYVVLNTEPSVQKIEKKKKMSLKESFSYLVRSRHLGYIALIVICYGISQNIIEGVWKGQIREVYRNENEYNAFMGHLTTFTGITTICCMLLGSNIVRIFGWFVSASLTPLMILLTGGAFFAFITFRKVLEPYTLEMVGISVAQAAVFVGFFQNILSKATKYSLFDPTKEMCYIPLDQESKVKGKAAVDVVGGRIGKSGGAFCQQFFLFATGLSLAEIAPYFSVVLAIAILLWLYGTKNLNQSLQKMEEEKPVEAFA